MFFTIEISRLGTDYKVRCAELDIEASAATTEEAMTRLKKIIDFTMATARENADEGPISDLGESVSADKMRCPAGLSSFH